jgi:hypothetical protein
MTNEILEVYALMERELYRLESLIKSLSSMSNQDLTLDELTILLAKHSSSTRKYEKLESLIYFSPILRYKNNQKTSQKLLKKLP